MPFPPLSWHCALMKECLCSSGNLGSSVVLWASALGFVLSGLAPGSWGTSASLWSWGLGVLCAGSLDDPGALGFSVLDPWVVLGLRCAWSEPVGGRPGAGGVVLHEEFRACNIIFEKLHIALHVILHVTFKKLHVISHVALNSYM